MTKNHLQPVFPELSSIRVATSAFPATRYQGSKYKLTDWIKYYTKDLSFDSVLDAFGGTGSIAYVYKQLGRKVFYNDVLRFNYQIGLALIENRSEILEEGDINFILKKHADTKYPTFIQDTFHDIYFLDEENAWLDVVTTNISRISNQYKKALAFYALFQACIIKRPYNLFHRKNLYIRLANVRRSFGNKKTWDTAFEQHFRNFADFANRAVFDNHRKNEAFCSDIFDLQLPEEVDFVYIDTPYISKRGSGVNYFDFYHFLEGLVDYDNWPKRIDYESKHKKLLNGEDQWSNKNHIHNAFRRLIHKYSNSILVVSYRDDGIPSIPELIELLKSIKGDVRVYKADYKYVLSDDKNKEVLMIAQ